MNTSHNRSQWRSFASYVLVTTGAIVGLGNIFQFPFLVIKYGGLFLLFYLLCQLSIVLPLLFAELVVGRRGMQNPIGSIGILTIENQANPNWRKLGYLFVLIAFLTISYYAVSAAFPVGYFIDNVSTLFHLQSYSASELFKLDETAISGFSHLEICFVVFLLLAMIVVYRGINRGLEEISFVTVPLYCALLLALAIYMSMQGYFGQTLHNFLMIYPGISIYEIFLVALALAFLKYKIGTGVIIVYGSYLPYQVSLAKSTLIIVAIDAFVSLMSYFIIYPLTLSSSGEGHAVDLSSHTVITIFNAIPHGLVISALFFFASILVAWTPIIAMGETIVLTLSERLNWSRPIATIFAVIGILVAGTLVVLTHMTWAHVHLFGKYELHNLLKNVTADFLMPLAAFFMSIFVGWIVNSKITREELRFNSFFYRLWLFSMRFLAPIAIFVVLFTVTVLEKSGF
jgi:NSS family neurotransmitter:Na+ symporter